MPWAGSANWMTNGQGSGSTATGAYELNGATSANAINQANSFTGGGGVIVGVDRPE
jgi:hypothetical protein